MINLIWAVITFLSSASHALSSWHFCVDQFFWAITIQAVEHLPFTQLENHNHKVIYVGTVVDRAFD